MLSDIDDTLTLFDLRVFHLGFSEIGTSSLTQASAGSTGDMVRFGGRPDNSDMHFGIGDTLLNLRHVFLDTGVLLAKALSFRLAAAWRKSSTSDIAIVDLEACCSICGSGGSPACRSGEDQQ